MKSAWKWIAALLAALALVTTPAAAAQKTAKSEVSKAIGKCVGSVLGGALLGALVGGRNNRGQGAALGAGAGAAVCAVIIAAAKRQDRVIAAQRAAAEASAMSGPQYTSFQDQNGKSVRLASFAEDASVTGKLIPVKYDTGGADRVSPEIAAGAPQCRYVSSEMSGAEGSTNLPKQLFCRSAEGSWEPYAVGSA
jgi:hypothetical protein